MDRTIIFNEAVDVVKSLGYKCIFPKYNSNKNEKPTHCYITDGINIGYMQSDWIGCSMSFSSVHKPNSDNGTGFGIADSIQPKDITKELIESTFVTKPSWAINNRGRNKISPKPIIKYKDWNDYSTNSLSAKFKVEFVEL